MQDARIAVLVGVVVAIGSSFGCSKRQQETLAEPQLLMPAQPTLPDARATFQPTLLARSVQGRDLVLYTLRGGPQTVLVIGGVHGSEPTSVDVANGLLELLRSDPSLARGRTIAILPNANPDGYEKRSRYNANQIDINRNFAATNFKPGMRAGFRSGTSPNSEPETQAIVRAIEITRPILLISIHSIDKGRECNNYDGPAEQIAQIMTKYNTYPPKATIGYATPGSLGSYAGIDRQIPMITLELPRALSGEQAWRQNREALLAAIAAENR